MPWPSPERPVTTLPLMSEAESHQVVLGWNATAVAFPESSCLHELFAEQVRRSPDAVALEYGEERLLYAELDRRVSGLARRLRRLGVGTDSLVGICAERSIEMVVGLLGILRAGGAYMPLDPSYPAERLAYMMEDSGLGVLLTQSWLEAGLPALPGKVLRLDDPALFAGLSGGRLDSRARWQPRRVWPTRSTPPARRAGRRGPEYPIAASSTACTGCSRPTA